MVPVYPARRLLFPLSSSQFKEIAMETTMKRYTESDIRRSVWTRYGFFWVTLILFLGSLIGHWVFAWYAFNNEQLAHGQTPEFQDYFVQTASSMLENWQSEFLQLIWQVAGLALFLYVGSPQSKEGDDRKEEKLDRILAAVHKNADRVIEALDHKYPRS
jgi:hypothetical protein